MPAKPTKTYFAEQLAGEMPLRQKTSSQLCSLAADIRVAEPWSVLTETQLIAVQRKKGSEPDFVSVLGAAGEHRGIFVYPGIRGYAWLQDMLGAEREAANRLLLTENESMQANFLNDDELTDLDVGLMKGCRYDPTPGCIQFRSVRRGYFPWYINEEEGRRLCECLDAFMSAVLSGLIFANREELWPESQPVMPMMIREKGEWVVNMLNMRLTRVNEPNLWVPKEALFALPSGPKSGAICLGDHILPGCAGLENERPTVLHMLAAVDHRSGFAYPPQLRTPGELWGVGASNVLLEAIRVRGAIPENVFVRKAHHAELLTELARVVGFQIQVKRHLPMLNELFREVSRLGAPPSGTKSRLVH